MKKAKQTIGQIARFEPATIEVFQSLGIKYCCHGQQEIGSALKAGGVGAVDLFERARQAGTSSTASKGPWVDPILEALILHLLQSRESLVKTDLPQLVTLARSVAEYGDNVEPNATEVAMVVEALTHEIESHLTEEKARLFPLIQNIELAYAGMNADAVRPKAFRHNVGKMIHQHEEIGYLLSAAHRLTDGYSTSSSDVTPYRDLCDKLKKLDREIREEVHLENNVLFNRALQFSNALLTFGRVHH